MVLSSYHNQFPLSLASLPRFSLPFLFLFFLFYSAKYRLKGFLICFAPARLLLNHSHRAGDDRPYDQQQHQHPGSSHPSPPPIATLHNSGGQGAGEGVNSTTNAVPASSPPVSSLMSVFAMGHLLTVVVNYPLFVVDRSFARAAHRDHSLLPNKLTIDRLCPLSFMLRWSSNAHSCVLPATQSSSSSVAQPTVLPPLPSNAHTVHYAICRYITVDHSSLSLS